MAILKKILDYNLKISIFVKKIIICVGKRKTILKTIKHKEELDKEYKEISEKYPLSKQSDNIDWEMIRINAAISAMQGLTTTRIMASYNEVAESAVKYADALIEELQKKK